MLMRGWLRVIESASVLAGNSMNAPLEGDIIVIRDTLSGELKNILDKECSRGDKLATDVADSCRANDIHT